MHVKGENGELGCQVCIEWRKKLMGENNQFETPDKGAYGDYVDYVLHTALRCEVQSLCRNAKSR